MRKKDLIKALEPFDDDDNLQLGEEAIGYIPQIKRVCGKGQHAMPYYCTKEPGHEGDCYCGCKRVYFKPEEN